MPNQPAKNDPKSWSSASLAHLPSVYASALIGFLASLLIVMTYPPAGSQGNLSGLMLERFWLPELVTAIWLGWFLYRRIPSRLAFLAWVPPAVFLIWNVLEWHRSGFQYDSTWDTFFGSHCGDSGCLYELLLTMPFYTGLGYSMGALLCKIVDRPPVGSR